MSLHYKLLTTVMGALLAITAAFGQVPARVRGTVVKSDAGSVTVKQRDGRTVKLRTGPDTTYAEVIPSSLDAIKVNDYIGTAVKGPLNHWIAVEIVLVPESMRAGRTGYYAWDPLPDTSGLPTSDIIATTTVNGSVSNLSPKMPKLIDTSMTNGVVTASEPGERGRTLSVTLAGNMTARILVSSSAPVVRFVPSDRSAILKGSTVVVWTKPSGIAGLVAVGKGVTPPM